MDQGMLKLFSDGDPAGPGHAKPSLPPVPIYGAAGDAKLFPAGSTACSGHAMQQHSPNNSTSDAGFRAKHSLQLAVPTYGAGGDANIFPAGGAAGSGHAKHSLQLALPSCRAAGDAKIFHACGAAHSGHAMQQHPPNNSTNAAAFRTFSAYSQGPQQRLRRDVSPTARPQRQISMISSHSERPQQAQLGDANIFPAGGAAGSGRAKHSLQLALPSCRAAGDAKIFHARGAAHSGHAMQQHPPNNSTNAAAFRIFSAYSQGPQQRLRRDVSPTARPQRQISMISSHSERPQQAQLGDANIFPAGGAAGSGHAKHSLQLALPSYRAAGDAKIFHARGAARSGHAMQQHSPNIRTDGSLRSHAFAAGYRTFSAYSQGPQQRLLRDVSPTAQPQRQISMISHSKSPQEAQLDEAILVAQIAYGPLDLNVPGSSRYDYCPTYDDCCFLFVPVGHCPMAPSPL
eukprot:gene13457-19317_t